MKCTRQLMGALIALMLLASADSAAASHGMSAGDLGLKGRMHTVTEQEVLLGENGTGEVVPLRTIYYDKDGKVLRLVTNKGLTACSDQGYRYDSQGRLIVSGRYDKDGVFVKEIEYRYDSDGRVTENRYLREDGSVFLIKAYRYNSAGNLMEEQHKSDGKVILTKKISQDRAKNETVIDTFGADGQLLTTERSRLDAHGVGEQEWVYHGDLGSYGTRQRITANDKDTLSTVCRLSDGSIYQSKVCDTWEGGSLKRTVHRADGSIVTEIFFNAAGDAVSIIRFTAEGGIEKSEKYAYQYDEQGNWTVKTVYEQLANTEEWLLKGETRRVFSYYE